MHVLNKSKKKWVHKTVFNYPNPWKGKIRTLQQVVWM